MSNTFSERLNLELHVNLVLEWFILTHQNLQLDQAFSMTTWIEVPQSLWALVRVSERWENVPFDHPDFAFVGEGRGALRSRPLLLEFLRA